MSSTLKADCGALDELAPQRIDVKLIVQHWEALLRLAGSLELGTAQAAGLGHPGLLPLRACQAHRFEQALPASTRSADTVLIDTSAQAFHVDACAFMSQASCLRADHASMEFKMTDENESPKSAGGRARAEKLTAEERSEIAKRGAVARWQAHLPGATHEGVLQVAGLELPVAVLSDGTRLMISKAFMTALGRPWKGSYKNTNLPNFIDAKNLLPFITSELYDVLDPVEFINKHGQKVQGYRAELLQMVCDVYLDARKAEVLTPTQERLASQAETLIRGFARIGIISLVDEATGYQRDRATDALAKILERFIAKELQPWVKTFPDEFYRELFRLRKISFPQDTVKRPQYFGHLTNDIIYRRLAPGILTELKNSSPKTASGKRKGTMQQNLTPDLGHPKLREHLASVTTIMSFSEDYADFLNKLDKRHPRYGENTTLDFGKDDGSGL